MDFGGHPRKTQTSDQDLWTQVDVGGRSIWGPKLTGRTPVDKCGRSWRPVDACAMRLVPWAQFSGNLPSSEQTPGDHLKLLSTQKFRAKARYRVEAIRPSRSSTEIIPFDRSSSRVDCRPVAWPPCCCQLLS